MTQTFPDPAPDQAPEQDPEQASAQAPEPAPVLAPGQTLEPARIAALNDCVIRAGALKDTWRSARTPRGARESTAAHSWSLCLMALLYARHAPEVDPLHLLKLCILHDLGEAISGDIPATEQTGTGKSAAERADLLSLCDGLPEDVRDEIVALWDEYEAGATPAARLAKGLDKCDTMLGHVGGAQGAGFDYLWNLDYGRRWTDDHPMLGALREDVDARTRAAAAQPD